MILALDVGNTNITLGCIGDGDIAFQARICTDHIKTDIQYAVEIKGILDFYKFDISTIEGSIISSVVPPLSSTLKNAIAMITGEKPLVVGPGIKTGLNILIDNPAQLGSDLVVAAVAAINLYPAPLAIFDLGTATTISVIDANKAYTGGFIMPGVAISLSALSKCTAQLPKISLENPKTTIGKNTIDSMQSGIVNANASIIDGMVERIQDEIGTDVTAVATGGISRFIVPHCKREIIYNEDLMLIGLELIFKKNQ